MCWFLCNSHPLRISSTLCYCELRRLYLCDSEGIIIIHRHFTEGYIKMLAKHSRTRTYIHFWRGQRHLINNILSSYELHWIDVASKCCAVADERRYWSWSSVRVKKKREIQQQHLNMNWIERLFDASFSTSYIRFVRFE